LNSDPFLIAYIFDISFNSLDVDGSVELSTGGANIPPLLSSVCSSAGFSDVEELSGSLSESERGGSFGTSIGCSLISVSESFSPESPGRPFSGCLLEDPALSVDCSFSF